MLSESCGLHPTNSASSGHGDKRAGHSPHTAPLGASGENARRSGSSNHLVIGVCHGVGVRRSRECVRTLTFKVRTLTCSSGGLAFPPASSFSALPLRQCLDQRGCFNEGCQIYKWTHTQNRAFDLWDPDAQLRVHVHL